MTGQSCGTCRFIAKVGSTQHYECTWQPPIKLPTSLHRHAVRPNHGSKCPTYQAERTA